MGASAGVYSREIDLSLYASNEAETYFGVIGHFSKGPLDPDAPTLITSYPQLIATYGTPRSDGTSKMWYACRNYLRRGNKLKVVRVESAANPALAASSALRGYDTDTLALSGSQDDGDCTVAGKFGSATAAFQTNNINPGDILVIADTGSPDNDGYYEIDVVDSETQVTLKDLTSWANPALTGLDFSVITGLRATADDGATSVPALREFTSAGAAFSGNRGCAVRSGDILSIEDDSGSDPEDNGLYLVESIPTATKLVVNRDFPVGSLTGLTYKVYSLIAGGDDGATSVPATRTLTSAAQDFTAHGVVAGDWVYVNDSGSVGDNGWFMITNVATTVLTVNRDWPEGSNTALTFSVFPSAVKLAGATKGTWGDNLEAFVTRNSAVATSIDVEIRENGEQVEKWFGTTYATMATDLADSDYVTVTSIAGRGGIPSDSDYDFAGGDDGITGITDADYIGGDGEGLQLFSSGDSEQVDAIAVPGESSEAIGNALITLAETRRNCMALIDTPDWGTIDSAQEVVQWTNGQGFGRSTSINSSFADVCWPWVKEYDEYNAAYVWVPPSGHRAATYAYNDSQAYPWYAPAGGKRGKLLGVSGIRYTPNQGDRDYLQGGTNIVNPVVLFTEEGAMFYGQKTGLRATTALNRISVRRMLIWLETQSESVLRNIVFDPNDEATWRGIKSVLNPLCAYIKAQRGISSYLVVCDATNNTAVTMANNQIIVSMYLKPVPTGEQIHIRYILTSQGANFEELIEQV